MSYSGPALCKAAGSQHRSDIALVAASASSVPVAKEKVSRHLLDLVRRSHIQQGPAVTDEVAC